MTIWEKIKKKMYIKIPRCLLPMEGFVHPNLRNSEEILCYKDILETEGKLKPKQEFITQGLGLS